MKYWARPGTENLQDIKNKNKKLVISGDPTLP